MNDQVQRQLEAAIRAYLAEQDRLTPHRDVSYAEVASYFRQTGHSEGAIFVAWNTIGEGGSRSN